MSSKGAIAVAIAGVLIGAAIFVMRGGEDPLPTPLAESPPQVLPPGAPGPGASTTPRAEAAQPPTPVALDPETPEDDPLDEAPTPDELLQRPDPDAPPLTDAAAAEPDMRELEGGVADYDAPTEAKQRFRTFELAAIARRPLTPEKWREIQGDSGDETLAVLRRAKQLTDAGEPEAAKELMEEWQRLTSLYRNEAYGRGQVLVNE